MKEFTLAVIESQGRRAPVVHTDPNGDITVYEWGGTPCPGCREMTGPGDPITNLHGRWWHARCAKTALQQMHPDYAWIALGTQVAAYPRRHKAAEIRAVIDNLIRIAERVLDGPERRQP